MVNCSGCGLEVGWLGRNAGSPACHLHDLEQVTLLSSLNLCFLFWKVTIIPLSGLVAGSDQIR